MRILIVDDDGDLRAIVGIILRRDGYEVMEAADGEEGLHCWRQRPADLILVDLKMPRMGGWELCERIRAGSTVPIVILSAAAQLSDLARGQALAVADHITKPFSPVELVARIRSALELDAELRSSGD
jgi:DNA-binding response OmpR family regulator